MKAIRVREFGPPAVMKLEDVPDPKPGPKQIVVAVKAAGSIPWIPTSAREHMRKSPRLPYTPGFDAAGIVESVGSRGSSIQAGRSRLHQSQHQRRLRREDSLRRGVRLPAAGSIELRAGRRCVGSLRNGALCAFRSRESSARGNVCSFTVPVAASAAQPCRWLAPWECGLSEPPARTKV